MIKIRKEQPEDIPIIRVINEQTFMVLILDRTTMQGVSGIVHYRSEFDDAM